MDLEAVADELYGVSPDDFVERRTQRVVEARATRDRPLVKAIGALRRPTRSAWMVNLLAREAPDEIGALLELGTALADAQRRAAGPDLRRLSTERHAALDRLTRRATAIATERGHSATEASRQEVTQTLQAALSDPSVAELVRTGRVIQPVAYGGFGPMDLLGLGAAPVVGQPGNAEESGPEPAPEVAARPTASDQAFEEPAQASSFDPPEDPRRLAADAAVQAAGQTLEDARAEAEEAEQAATAATDHADELADFVDSLRNRLAEAEAEERAARETARAARKDANARRQATEAAERELAEARSALEALGPS